MTVTEDEARKKCCHVTKHHVLQADGAKLVSFNCIGSNCMAWRWKMPDKVRNGMGEIDKGAGFCGLAGPVS